jgi:hypothetical protein
VASWYKITVDSSKTGIGGVFMQIQNSFSELFMKAGPSRNNAAMFAEHTAGSDFHYIYFSPQAALIAGALIASHGAIPCSQPILSDQISLCVGNSGDRERLLKAPENN